MFYLQATFKGWMDIMYAAVDSVDVSVDRYNTKLDNFKNLLSLDEWFSNYSCMKPYVYTNTTKNFHHIVA